jgi:hypothetical protein
VLRAVFDAFFADHDALLCPVCPVPAPAHAQRDFAVGGTRVPAHQIMRATAPFNLTVLRLGELLEAVSPVHGRRPSF